jgi:hypothetical protein
MKVIKSLYNGIMNDYSIQKYSLGWSDIVKRIKKRYRKPIQRTDETFDNKTLQSAIKVATGNFKKQLEAFARELSINIETFHDKK